METKEQMQDFTDSMIQQIDEFAFESTEKLKAITEFVQGAGKKIADDCCHDMKKMRYCVRDYQNVYDIADNDFSEPALTSISVSSCLKEVQYAVQNDLFRQGVEVSLNINESCPKYI